MMRLTGWEVLQNLEPLSMSRSVSVQDPDELSHLFACSCKRLGIDPSVQICARKLVSGHVGAVRSARLTFAYNAHHAHSIYDINTTAAVAVEDIHYVILNRVLGY